MSTGFIYSGISGRVHVSSSLTVGNLACFYQTEHTASPTLVFRINATMRPYNP
jgi:hypothetical protein